MMKSLLVFLSAFIVTYITTYVIIKFSSKNKFGLDQPGRRRVHKTPTVRIGGLGLYIGLIAVMPYLEMTHKIWTFVLGGSIILAVGLWDDIKGVKWLAKVAAILAATTIMVFYADIRITTLGNLFGYGNIELGMWSIPFTYFCVLGIVNAVNLIDGLNGLAGGISLIAFLFLAYFAYISGHTNLFYVNLAAIGGLAAFLRYNFPNGRIFLGDCGSMLIGFLLALTAISLFKTNQIFEPMVPVLILAVPLFDTMRVMLHRIIKGKHPFVADKTHLHHILVRTGICHKNTALSIWTMSLFFGVSALILKEEAGWLQLMFLIFAYSLMGIFITLLLEINTNKRRKFIKAIRERSNASV